MRLQHIEINGFKSFAKKSSLSFSSPVTSIVGPNGSGKSNVVEAFRFVLGEQSMKSMRGKSGSDLIFRGSNTTNKLSRASVSITFDNSDKVFAFRLGENDKEGNEKSPLLFDTVTFTREIFADGASKYLLNGTEIRLKQMVELLASVNIGTSTHHIISQGEADGILRASTKDRRDMLEDALGLKIYHYRIKESESKLTKSSDALKEVQSLRRELAPHLSFLKKQVEKLEKVRAIREELEQLLLKYLSSERKYIQNEDSRIAQAESFIKNNKIQLEETLSQLPQNIVDAQDQYFEIIQQYKRQLDDLNNSRRSFEQKINRLEGIIYAQNKILSAQKPLQNKEQISFSQLEYKGIINDISFLLENLKNAQNLEEVRKLFESLSILIDNLKKKEPITSQEEKIEVDTHGIKEIALELEDLEQNLKNVLQKETTLKTLLFEVEKKREDSFVDARKSTEDRYTLINEIKQAEAEQQILLVNKNIFLERKSTFDTELKESSFLFGPNFLHTLQNLNNNPELIQEIDIRETRRSIERLKIRLDEHSGIGGEVLTEYDNTKERDEFLTREVIDIEGSIKNLEGLIIDLKKFLDEKFNVGVQKINEKFGDFFKIMFGGGSAFLTITLERKRKHKLDTELVEDEDIEDSNESDSQLFERGIDVNVSLPTKKVKELNMLSGGERSLVSIALLFAISQVNPPPFLVLDETDAALDESNSRKYGDMIERLSHYSQLIVITHNRETMSRANMLYGVTLGLDGGSKLLSIKFDEAIKVAK